MIFYERRKLVIALIVGSVLVIGIIIFVVVRLSGKDPAGSGEPESTPFTEPVTGSVIPAVPPKDPDKQAAESLARFFVERIGSYSNQSNFQNLTDVESFMTARVRTWAAGLKKVASGETGYLGTTTKVLTVDLIDWRPRESAVIRTGTQRKESAESGSGRLYYQDAEVHLVFQNNAWLVDGIYWKEERGL